MALTQQTPRDVDWAWSVVGMLAGERRLSPTSRAAKARFFAARGNYTEEARQMLREYADGCEEAA